MTQATELHSKLAELDENIPENCMPNISVDNMIFAMVDGKLKVLLVKFKKSIVPQMWGLIGHWIYMDEDLYQAAQRIVKQTTGAKNFHLEQLQAFGSVDRYPLRRIVTVAYYALVRYEEVSLNCSDNTREMQWFDVREIPQLMFDHNLIIESCLSHLQYKVRHEPIGFSLLPEKFTLLQLQTIYESILNIKLDKPNFRRKIQKMNLLINCKEKQTDVIYRAASLYRFDIHVYEKLREFGFNFEY